MQKQNKIDSRASIHNEESVSALPLSSKSLTKPIVDLGDLPVNDYWGDRRVLRTRYDGAERRILISKRGTEAWPDDSKRGLYQSLRRSSIAPKVLLLLGDLLSLVAATLVALSIAGEPINYMLRFDGGITSPIYQFYFAACCFLGWNIAQDNYTKRRTMGNGLAALLKAVFIAVSVQAILAGLFGDRKALLVFFGVWLIALICMPWVRLFIARTMNRFGFWSRPTVIIGDGENARNTAKAISSDWLLGYNVVEFIACEQLTMQIQNTAGKSIEASPLSQHNYKTINVEGHRIPIRRVKELSGALFSELNYPEIVVAIDSLDFMEITSLLYEAEVSFSRITVVPPLRNFPINGLDMSHVLRHDVLLLAVQNNMDQVGSRIIKRTFDLLGALFISIILSPLLLGLAVLVRLSGKKIIFAHERVGMNGKLFNCYKFRSMVSDSDKILERLLASNPAIRKEWEETVKLKNDPRITRLGKYLRKSSLDELPQLWNVIKGDMSLVGPRPVTAEELNRYEGKKNHYYMARPGITGLWQVSGRSDVDYNQRIHLDSWYARNWSLWYDMVILYKTAAVVMARTGSF